MTPIFLISAIIAIVSLLIQPNLQTVSLATLPSQSISFFASECIGLLLPGKITLKGELNQVAKIKGTTPLLLCATLQTEDSIVDISNFLDEEYGSCVEATIKAGNKGKGITTIKIRGDVFPEAQKVTVEGKTVRQLICFSPSQYVELIDIPHKICQDIPVGASVSAEGVIGFKTEIEKVDDLFCIETTADGNNPLVIVETAQFTTEERGDCIAVIIDAQDAYAEIKIYGHYHGELAKVSVGPTDDPEPIYQDICIKLEL